MAPTAEEVFGVRQTSHDGAQLDDALAIFLVLAELFPESDVAFDSLGEVYQRLGDNAAAIASFEKALELNPENGNAAEKLRELKG